MYIPIEGEAAWMLHEGPKPYWRGASQKSVMSLRNDPLFPFLTLVCLSAIDNFGARQLQYKRLVYNLRKSPESVEENKIAHKAALMLSRSVLFQKFKELRST
jgi:hypothetical protein